MADIFQEVDEDLRRDRASALWRRYGKFVLAGAVVLVLATAAWSGWRHYRNQQQLEAGTKFTQALILANQGQDEAAGKAFAEVAGGSASGFAMLGRLETANLKARAGDRPGAIAIYEAVAADSSVPEPYRQGALLLAVMNAADSGDPKALADRLQPLAADGSPWRHSARELQAVLAQKAGDLARARTLLQSLADDAQAPQGVKQRAGEMMRAIGGGA